VFAVDPHDLEDHAEDARQVGEKLAGG